MLWVLAGLALLGLMLVVERILYLHRGQIRAKAFVESPDLRETMQAFGVTDKPDVYFLND